MAKLLVKWIGVNKDKGKTLIDGLPDKATGKTFLQHLDNYTLASAEGYRIEPAFETDAAGTAITGEHPYIRDQLFLHFDVIKASGGEVERVKVTVPAPDSTYLIASKDGPVFSATEGDLIAGYLKTATSWNDVKYVGSKFKSSIAKGTPGHIVPAE